MKHTRQLTILALGFGLSGLIGCDRGGAHNTVPANTEVAKPIAAGDCVSFDRVLKTVIEPKCKMCHGDGSPNKNWTDYKLASQFGANIVDKIANTPPKMGGSPMPLGGSLSKAEIDLLQSWVEGGSKETCASSQTKKPTLLAPLPPVVGQSPSIATNCTSCHGADGKGLSGAVPNLAGQSVGYIEKQLRDFRSKDRVDPVMSGVAQQLKDAEISELAKYFNSQKNAIGVQAEKAIPAPADVVVCLSCHGSAGVADSKTMPNVPNLAGQKQEYIIKQLVAFKSQTRHDSIMQGMTSQLNDRQINAIAKYFSEL